MNKLTNLLGILIIIAAPVSIFLLDKVTWWDSLAGILAGCMLIYVKSASFTELFREYLKKGK